MGNSLSKKELINERKPLKKIECVKIKCQLLCNYYYSMDYGIILKVYDVFFRNTRGYDED